jgi:hypothetical protein
LNGAPTFIHWEGLAPCSSFPKHIFSQDGKESSFAELTKMAKEVIKFRGILNLQLKGGKSILLTDRMSYFDDIACRGPREKNSVLKK